MYICTIKYTLEDVDYRFCKEYEHRRCTVENGCPYLAERIEAGAVDYEVIPSIRKHGAYITKESCGRSPPCRRHCTSSPRKTGSCPEKPIITTALWKTNACTNLRETAKELAVSERKLARFLIDAKLAYRAHGGHLLSYAKPSNEGLFVVRDYVSRNGYRGSYMLITPQGKDTRFMNNSP